jgi:uncharacterized protein DUF2846
MSTKSLFAGALILLAAALAGCNTMPLAKPEADTLAKQMKPVADKAVIFLFRNEAPSAPWALRVTLDGKEMGDTSAQTYFRWTVEPGEHMIVSYSENAPGLLINAEPGHVYYVWQEVNTGFFQPRTELHLVDRMTAETALRTCYLLEGKS